MVHSRRLVEVENVSLLVFVIVRYAGLTDRVTRTARVSFQFQHTVTAAAAAAAATRCQAAAV